MLRFMRLTCFVGVCLLLCFPAAAQDNTNPLLDMLKLVPDDEQARAGIPLVSYADYRAIEAGRGIETPPTKADFDSRSDKSSLWIAATNGLMSGMRLDYFMQYLEGMEEAVGFSWFDVDRALTFGLPPGMGNLLVGDFDAEAIAAAFEARDYTLDNQDDVPVWCGPSGCDEGLKQNLTNRNPANPFGGVFGREEPVALLPGVVANSASYAVLSAILAAHQGDLASLADDPNILAAANVIAAKGTLRQAQLFNGVDVGSYGDMAATDEAEQPEFLPRYSLAFFADAFDGEEQIALIGLVYDDEAPANTAATLLVDHLQMAESMAAGRPFMELIEDRGGIIAGAGVETDAETGKFVAVLDIRYP
ncbi:MAG: hypothetical protein K8I30_05720, partial [Anaerolineae bacterium]|nr:hypothetical protein [Anaerolineae bacterium]